jgi:hypothetical protein
LKKLIEWFGQVGVFLDKLAIKVPESEERSNLFDRPWNGPVSEAGKLGRVHLDHSFSNDKSKEIDFLAVKEALFGFEEQVVVAEFTKDAVSETL